MIQRRSIRRLNERQRARVNVDVWLHDLLTGKTVLWDRGHNLVTTAGLNLIRDRLYTGGNPISHFAIGTDDTPVAAGDTTLGAEVFRDVFTQTTPDDASLLVRYYLGPTDGNGNTIKEAGILNAATFGDLYARRVLSSSIVKTVAVAVTFNWTLDWSAS